MIEMSDQRLGEIAVNVVLFADYGDRGALTGADARELLAELVAMRELCDTHHLAVIGRLTAEVSDLRDQLAATRATNPPRNHHMTGGQDHG